LTVFDNKVLNKYLKLRKGGGGEENYILRRYIISDLHMVLLKGFTIREG
jgi:hypothetical protein